MREKATELKRERERAGRDGEVESENRELERECKRERDRKQGRESAREREVENKGERGGGWRPAIAGHCSGWVGCRSGCKNAAGMVGTWEKYVGEGKGWLPRGHRRKTEISNREDQRRRLVEKEEEGLDGCCNDLGGCCGWWAKYAGRIGGRWCCSHGFKEPKQGMVGQKASMAGCHCRTSFHWEGLSGCSRLLLGNVPAGSEVEENGEGKKKISCLLDRGQWTGPTWEKSPVTEVGVPIKGGNGGVGGMAC